MSHLRWPTVFLTVLKVLGQLHEVTSDDRIVFPQEYDTSDNNRYSVQQSDSPEGIQNFTSLESSHVPSAVREYQEETPVTPSSPDYAMLDSDEVVNISTFLEPNNNGNQYTGANSEVSIPSEGNRRNISSFIEPNTSSPEISSKVNVEIHISPLSNKSYIPIANLSHQESEESMITVSQLDEEKLTTISEEQNTLPTTLPSETDPGSFITTTLITRNVRHQNEDDIIQHIPISAKSKTLTVPEQRTPHEVYSVGNEKAFTKWEYLPEVTETTFYTEISVQRQTTEGYQHFDISSDSPRKDSHLNEEVDLLRKNQSNDTSPLPLSQSIINGHNIDQEIQNPKTVKSTSNAGTMVTSNPNYHPNDVMHLTGSQMYPSDMIINTTQKEKHPCARMCKEDEPSMTCRYNFSLEWYYTMSKACYNCPLNLEDCDRQDCVPADGVRRPIVVVNRALPGPNVEVCKGDRIIVNMENRMMEESTTIHWHGHHQRGTQYMDGVPYLTQCPIPPKSTFLYHYTADTPGTHFWHSHSADSLVSYAGERFDFVLNANNKVGNYWMRFRGLMDCDERFTMAYQVAVLHYDGAPELEEPPGEVSYEAARREGLQVNSLNVGRGSENSLVIPELNATVDDDVSLKEKPDMTFYLSYDFYKIDNPHYHRAPFYGFNQGKAYDANHPFHLHGHAFRVVAMERLGSTTSVEEVQALDKAGQIYRKLQGAPVKDTVTVPDGGFTIVRVHANNPGYWLFHCHIEFHVELGMAVVFKVGEHSDFPPPPRGFPQCNSYIPSEEELEHTNEEDNEIGAPVISITHWWPLRSSGTSKLIAIPLIPLLIMAAAVR
ncbi:hypothetical protein C0J52_17819 [Blattella germanica]|nr:hypothetical protein C0J52_17819 [Blattella germanica]